MNWNVIERTLRRYGVIFLIILYLGINIIYRKISNLIIFVGLLMISYPFFTKKINSILISLIISLFIGIYRNFHLLENFDERNSYMKMSKLFMDTFPSYKITKINISINEMKPIRTNKNWKFKMNKLKDKLDSGYYNIKDFPIIISKDNYIVQGHTIYYLMKQYDELRAPEGAEEVYMISVELEEMMKNVPLIKAKMGDVDFHLVDILG
jgi:hypothetical protein